MPTLDYLGIRLTKEFDFKQFLIYAQQDDIDPKTGQVLGYKIPEGTFQLSARGGYHIVSLYKGSEREGVKLAIRYGLDVSRIDIAVDVVMDNPSDEYLKYLSAAEKWHDEGIERGVTMPLLNSFKGTPNRRNGANGFRIGAPSSDNQLRVYNKARIDGTAKGIRLEYQLRGDNSRAVWAAIKADAYNEKELKYQFDACLNRYHPNCLPIKVNEMAVLHLEEKGDKKADTRAWLTSTILSSIVKFYENTGEDMTQVLAVMFKEALAEKAEKKAERVEKSNSYSKKLALLEAKLARKSGTFNLD